MLKQFDNSGVERLYKKVKEAAGRGKKIEARKQMEINDYGPAIFTLSKRSVGSLSSKPKLHYRGN